MKKRLIAFLLVLIMVLGMLPVSALAADDGISPQALNTGHKIDVRFTVLYVGDEFRIGYNYGASENTQFVCQYSTNHSDTAYNNHTIAISDIKAAADRATVNSGYQIVGWSKEANANPKTWGFDLKDPTACNKGTTIYLVAKNPNPNPTYMYYLYYKYNDGTNSTWLTEVPDRPTTATTFTFHVNTAKLKDRRGYEHIGWADKADAAAAKYTGGEPITLTKDDPAKTIYDVWEESAPQPPLIPVPSYDDLKSAIGKIQVKDVSTPGCGTENYDLIDNTQSEPFNWTKTARLDQPGKYDVTIKTAPYVAKYNSEKTKTHELNNANQTTLRLVISYENSKWVLDDGLRVIEVKHSEQTPPVDKPNPPTEDNLLGLYIAKVYCAMPANHGPKDFTYLMGTLDTSRTYTVDENGFCTVYLSVAPYVAAYNGYYTSSSHARRAEDPATVPVTLVYRTDHWEVAREGDAEALADIPVYCAETPVKPAKPTALDGSFAIVCKNNEATHAYKADYIATPSQYTISDVQTDEQGYYVTATVTVAPNLAAYNNLTGAEHRLVNEQDATLTITFRYDTEVTVDGNRKWKQQGEVPVVEVICKPKAPTADDLKKLEMAVQVKCVVDDSQQHTEAYGLLGEYDEDYFVGEPRKDGDDWLCDINYYPERYVAAFNTTFQNLKHVQNDEKIVPVTLIWAGDSWQLKEQGRVPVTEVYTVTYTDGVENEEVFADQVYSDLRKDSTTPAFNGTPTRTGYTFAGWEPEVAETVTQTVIYVAMWTPVEPKAPTAEELEKLEMAVQVKCVVDDSQQHTEAYGLLGEYDEDYFVGEPRKDGDDWLCDINYYPERYVAAFNTTFQNLKHVQNDEKIVPVTLIWAGDSWQLKTQGRVHVTEEYTVTYNAYGGFPTPDEQHVKSGEKAVLPVEPTLKGYTFAFWYLGEDEQNATAYDFDTPVTENITLTAKWEINKYTVTFDSYGGSKVDPQVVEYGLYAQEPEEPTLKGFTFAYWYLDDENEAYDFDTTPITEDITLTAKWEINKFKVTFDTDGGEPIPDDQFVEWGLFVEEPTTEPTKTGYTFDGWYLGDEKYDFSAAVEQNITLTAKWEAKKANVHLMIFKSGDLSTPIVNVPYTTDKLAGDTIDLAEIDLSSYLDFDFEIDGGWYDDGLFNLYKKYVNGEQENKPAALTELQITGNWQNLKLIVTELVPVVYFDSLESLTAYQNDHSKTEGILHTTKARLGSALPTADAPTATREGYTFTFWSREGQTVDVTDQTVNGWTNLYANWEITPHNIYAYARLNSYFAPLTNVELYEYVKLNAATLERLGLGSYNANDFISIGKFSFKQLPLTEDMYFGDDAELDAVAAELAKSIALETGVSKETAEKIAWTVLYKTENEEDMAPGYPAEDGYQLSGNLNLATVMFEANGENVTGMPAVNYTYDEVAKIHDFYFAGDTFTMPADPTREGYIFEGWSVKVLPDENDADHLDADGADDAADETLLKAGDTYTITAGGVVFTAQWEARTDTPYTVEHYLENLDGSYALDTTEPLKGTTDTTVTAAAKSYDNFTYDSTVPGTVASGNIAGDGSLVLKLFYTRNTYDYTVRHIKQLPDGTYDEANAEVETLSGKFEALATVTAKDYGEHYPTNDADTKQNIKIEKDLTIDVKYDLDEHTLTFETNGGSAIEPITVRHGNAVARPADPTKDKYTFIGWYVDPEFTEEYDFATVLEADKTIYAKFELTSTPIGDIYVRYDVLHIKQLPDGSYDLANAEVEHLSAKKDTTVTAVVKDYRATHHINVNSTLSKLTDTAIQPYPGADGKPVYTILSVYYDLDFHTLTFDTMGGSRIDPVTVRHGNAVAKPKDPVNGGYIFDGWYTDKTYRTPYNFATVLTQDTTIYAKWFLIALPGVTIKKTTPKLNTSDHFAYVQGYPDGTVKPTGNITRAETAAILFRLMDEGSRKTYYSTKSGFRDVATGSWYNTYVATLNNAGVITDSSNGYFRPNEAITRAELAAMLANFTETAGAANYFNDVSARYWAANAIAICAKLGWITGYPDGSFRPDRNVTRAELMAMINRATGRAPKSADAFLPGMKTWSDNTADKWYYLDVQEATNSHSYTVKDSEKWTALNADPNWSLYE